MVQEASAGEQLAAISREMDARYDAWAAAGYTDGSERAAIDAVYARLKAWNTRFAA